MPDRSRRDALLREAGAKPVVGGELRGDELQRNVAVEWFVERVIHHSHATAPGHVDDDMAGKRGAWSQVSHRLIVIAERRLHTRQPDVHKTHK
jgi:hypothetical protein